MAASQSGKIQILENHQPALPAGDYTITVDQVIQHEDTDINKRIGKPDDTDKNKWNGETFSLQQKVQKFSVLGPRFTLDPHEIQAVFPPVGSLGEHSNVLPHIILKRSTLPWERRVFPLTKTEEDAVKNNTGTADAVNGTAKKKIPWLALLLFDSDEQLGGIIRKEDFLTEYEKVRSASDNMSGEDVWTALYTNGCLQASTLLETDQFALLQVEDDGLKAKITSDTLRSKVISFLSRFRVPQTITLQKLKQDTSKQSFYQFPMLPDEMGDNVGSLNVIDVPAALVVALLAQKEELALLAHVRETISDADGAQNDEVSVVICNRLPQSGKSSTVHLVSLEGHSALLEKNGGGSKNTLVRLVSLYSWRFTCLSEKQSFKGLLMHLNHQLLFNIPISTEIRDYLNDTTSKITIPKGLQQAFLQSNVPSSESIPVIDHGGKQVTERNRCYFIGGKSRKIYDQGGKYLNLSIGAQLTDSKALTDELKSRLNFRDAANITDDTDHWWLGADQPEYFLSVESNNLYVYHLDPDSSSTLRLPSDIVRDADTNQKVKRYLDMGCVPLPHEMRQGNKSVSWYHGPLIPGTTQDNVTNLPIQSADEVIRYGSDIGMFDVSYSAAWELGRLLTLQNKRVSLDLFNWKRNNAQSFKDEEGQLEHLPFEIPAASTSPESVQTWFEELALLKGLPFNYLVPDERMLPTESIRFFQVDSSWVECMLDGAFSIGRVLPKDHDQDSDLRKHLPGEKKFSGFLVRSDIVAGWPGLLVDGYIIVNDKASEDKIINDFASRAKPAELLSIFQEQGLSFFGIDDLLNASVKIDSSTKWRITNAQPSYEITIEEISADSWKITNSQLSYKISKEELPGNDYQVLIKLQKPRMDRVSKNVLLCLFEGIIQAIDIHLKPETLHFGVSEGDDDHPVAWYKTPRNPSGDELPSEWKEVSLNDKNVIDIAALAQNITTNQTSAEFALQMIEGVEKVRFVQKTG